MSRQGSGPLLIHLMCTTGLCVSVCFFVYVCMCVLCPGWPLALALCLWPKKQKVNSILLRCNWCIPSICMCLCMSVCAMVHKTSHRYTLMDSYSLTFSVSLSVRFMWAGHWLYRNKIKILKIRSVWSWIIASFIKLILGREIVFCTWVKSSNSVPGLNN